MASSSSSSSLTHATELQPSVNSRLESPDTMTLDGYAFPRDRLKKVLSDPSKTPLVLVNCGSFSPPTLLHLRMFELARSFSKTDTNYEVVGGFFSPVGDAYKKAGLAQAYHRINMTRIATESSNWIGVDPWEPLHKEYLPTVQVLDHFDYELNDVMGGMETATGEKKRIHVALLSGTDLIQTMSTPGLWATEDLNRILGDYGAFALERSGTDTEQAVSGLSQWRSGVRIIPQLIPNEVSSTRVRLSLKRGMSIRYLVPDQVVDYIYEHKLYMDDPDSQNSSASALQSVDAAAAAAAAAAAS